MIFAAFLRIRKLIRARHQVFRDSQSDQNPLLVTLAHINSALWPRSAACRLDSAERCSRCINCYAKLIMVWCLNKLEKRVCVYFKRGRIEGQTWTRPMVRIFLSGTNWKLNNPYIVPYMKRSEWSRGIATLFSNHSRSEPRTNHFLPKLHLSQTESREGHLFITMLRILHAVLLSLRWCCVTLAHGSWCLVRFSRLISWKIQPHNAELASVRGSKAILTQVIQQRLCWLCTSGNCRSIARAAVFAA